jgi:hypothetical protein
MLLLVSEMYAFADWMKEQKELGADLALHDAIDLFASYLQETTVEPVFRLSTETGEHVLMGDSSCGVDESGIRIVMYNDSQFPDQVYRPPRSHPLLQKLTAEMGVDRQAPCIDLWHVSQDGEQKETSAT